MTAAHYSIGLGIALLAFRTRSLVPGLLIPERMFDLQAVAPLRTAARFDTAVHVARSYAATGLLSASALGGV
jgi:hypothetical protein